MKEMEKAIYNNDINKVKKLRNVLKEEYTEYELLMIDKWVSMYSYSKRIL